MEIGKPNNYPGLYVVFEGIDGAGKGTQMEMTEAYLRKQGYCVLTVSEPSFQGDIGRIIRKWLTGEAKQQFDEYVQTLLYAADRYSNLTQRVIPALENGCIVISERSYPSTYAYQAGLQHVDREWIGCIHRYVVRPDAIIYIRITPDEAIKRTGQKERFEKQKLQRRLYEEYERMAKEMGFITIDGMKMMR